MALERAYARVVFRKTGRLRYLGHLDVVRAFDRAVRRAKLPVEYSQGFSPHAQISFAMPLPVGVAGERELCAIDLAADWQAIAVFKGLQRQLPADLGIVEAQVLPRPKRSPFADLVAADYRVVVAIAPETLAAGVAALEQQAHLPVRRTTKSRELELDLRGRIKSLVATGKVLQMRLGLTDEDLAKPDEVLRVLGEQLGRTVPVDSLTRVALWSAGEG